MKISPALTEDIGKRLGGLRRSLGRNQSDFIAMMPSGLSSTLSQRQLSRIEVGKARAQFELIIWYADTFEVTTDFLLGRNN
jgi:transcriptional regulator with XRE-family HTH domain